VHTNATFSPDGSYLIFSRAEALQLPDVETKENAFYKNREQIERAIAKRGGFRYDLYRIPFDEGRGGKAVPVQGAADNGMSNYFPAISPDGKWLVFTKARRFNLLQPDSRLYIVSTSGGEPREMTCNTREFNSWHSFAPNGRWMVFASKARGPYTQLYLTHIDEQGRDTPAVELERFSIPERAANIPVFANVDRGMLHRIRTAD
jgi:Tol biopolymer transport system component